MISIVIPAFNEEAIIADMIRSLHLRVGLAEAYEVIVVDDGSTDATPGILQELADADPRLRVVRHPQNLGLGAALLTGFQAAQGRIVVTMDADLTHTPEMIPQLVEACTVDFVVASRYVVGGGMVEVPAWRVVLSRVANIGFQVLFLTRLRDITSGFKAYRTERLRELAITSRGFEVQLEITVRLLKSGATFVELPYVLKNREAGESKMRYLRLIPRYLHLLISLIFLRVPPGGGTHAH